MALRICADSHRPKLEAHEPGALVADALLPKKYGSTRNESQVNGHYCRQQAKKGQCQEAAREVDRPLPRGNGSRGFGKQIFYKRVLWILRVHFGGVVVRGT